MMATITHLRHGTFSASVAQEENDTNHRLEHPSQLPQPRTPLPIFREGICSLFDGIQDLDLGLALCETTGEIDIIVEVDTRAILINAYCIGPEAVECPLFVL
jgi:hypothetical protein